MAGIEDIVVEWAPLDPPITAPDEPTWETLTSEWQSIKTSGGAETTDLTQLFTIGSADITVRNGDITGRTPVFVPHSSQYWGVNIRVLASPGGTVIWRGRIDRVEYDYTKTPFAAFVKLHCVDTVGNVSDADVPDELFDDVVDYFTQVQPIYYVVRAIFDQLGATRPMSGEFSNQLVKAPDKFEERQSLLDFLNAVLLTEGATIVGDPTADALLVRGRWWALRLLENTTPTYTFTDGESDGVTSFSYQRDDFEWFADRDHYANSVQAASKYLAKTVTVEEVPFGYPKVQLSHVELVTIRQGWVEANARMWFALSNLNAYPAKLKFMVASHGLTQPASVVALAASPTSNTLIHVLHTPPGTTDQLTYRVAVDFTEHDIDRQRWLCTLGFRSLDDWWTAYGNGINPIALIEIDGDADHGIDSEAIIAP